MIFKLKTLDEKLWWLCSRNISVADKKWKWTYNAYHNIMWGNGHNCQSFFFFFFTKKHPDHEVLRLIRSTIIRPECTKVNKSWLIVRWLTCTEILRVDEAISGSDDSYSIQAFLWWRIKVIVYSINFTLYYFTTSQVIMKCY